ncbi:MAG: NAD(P)/FAD-dependent oxidoreductase [Burkholderiales bacterium]
MERATGTKRPAPSVAIIGAGFGGIAAAVRLKQAGFDDLTLFEQSPGPGGTWWDNRYPGAECDVEIAFYQFSFMPKDWPRTHASAPEIQAYVESVIDRFHLGDRIRYSTAVTSVVWDDVEHRYNVVTRDGASSRFDVVVSAVGLLNVPRYPAWPGLEDFDGPRFHTARWEHQHDLSGKRVAVVGAGSSAAQVVPAIASIAREVLMFWREPAYVMPKNERDLSAAERRTLASRFGLWRARARVFWRIERDVSVREPTSARQRRARAAYAEYRDRLFADRPDLRTAMSPEYPYACKRPVLSTNLFPALKRENVRVVTRSVERVTRAGLVDSEGVEHAVDAIVMATGFTPWNFLRTFEVVGRAGRTLHGVWGDEPEAYLGLQVAGFPNFFMMYGPNTNFFCVTFMLERQADYIVRAVRRLRRGRATAIDVRRSFMDAYNRALDRSLSGKALEAGCSNYYHSASGRNVVTFPWRGSVYALLTRFGALGQVAICADRERRRGHRRVERSSVHAVEARTARRAAHGPDRSSTRG